MDGIFGILNDNKDKTSNSDHLLSSKAKRKRAGEKGNLQSLGFLFSSERVSDFSLKSWAIRPSNFFGSRSKAVLLSEGFASQHGIRAKVNDYLGSSVDVEIR